jgi:hypothetical protein
MRYILFKIERHLSDIQYDYNSDKYNIEHVLPQNPEDNWPDYTEQQVDNYLYRIGNMTLLAAGANRDVGNKPYQQKRIFYQQSEFKITTSIAAEHQQWLPERIVSRQKWLANQATAIWRIAELS